MTARVLQLNFKFSISGAEYEQAAASLASEFADVAGLRWKVWLLNESENEAGGLYLFDSDSSLQAFLSGPLAARVMSLPVLSDFSAKQFDVMADVSAITRGPV
jgi:hypothetical protein